MVKTSTSPKKSTAKTPAASKKTAAKSAATTKKAAPRKRAAVKKQTVSTSQKVDYYPNRMTLAISALAGTLIVLLALIAVLGQS
jgi:hypothetical protein